MTDRYCLTANEAAETANIGLDDLMAIVAGRRDVAIRLGDSWRVDPDALSAALSDEKIRQAA